MKKFSAAVAAVLSVLTFYIHAEQYLPNSDGAYSVSYKGVAFGNYVITAIKGLYASDSEALDALYAAQDSDIIFYDTGSCDSTGNLTFDNIIPITYTDASVFISGTGLDKPFFAGEMLANGNVDIAKAVFVGIDEEYTVQGKSGTTISETVSAYTVDSFGYPTLSNPALSLSLENPDEYVSFSAKGVLTISPMAAGGNYTIKASLEDSFSDTFTFSVAREPARPYEISLYRADAHDRPLTNASLVGVDGVFPTLEVYAKSTDQYGNEINDEYTYFCGETEYPNGFTPDDVGEYEVIVASKINPDVKATLAVIVTDRPEYEGNAALLYGAVLEAFAEIDRIDYEVFLSSEAGKDIYPDKLWTSENALTTLKNAVATANTALSKYSLGTVSESSYLTSYNTMTRALATYRNSIKNGVRIDAEKIILSQTNINIATGRTANISATLEPTNNTDVITWSVSDTNVLSLNNGVIRAQDVGEAYVTATTRTGLSESCRVYVYKRFTTVAMLSSEQEILLGEENAYIQYEARPADGGDKLSWTSSDETVATIGEDGKITAYKEGRTTVTATSLFGKVASCVLLVKLPADTIQLDVEPTVNLSVDDKITVHAAAARLDGLAPASTAVTFRIIESVAQNEGDTVVTLGANGYLRAVSGGMARIRVQAEKALGNIYKDFTVYVNVPSTSISISAPRKNLAIGNTLSLYAVLLPDDATDEVTWYSSKESVATVNQSGVVTAVSLGTARIYASTSSGLRRYCTVSVGLGANSVEILSRQTSVNVGQSFVLRAKAVRDDGKRCIDSDVIYSVVSGKKYASVNSYGVVKGLSNGEAVIRITPANGEPNAYTDITVNVCEIITDMSFIKKTQEMYVGQSFDFASLVSALPETHTDLITFESSDTRYITVTENGMVSALREGSARLYAYAGNLRAYITVNIGQAAQAVEISAPPSSVLTFGENFILTALVKGENENVISSDVVWESSDEDILSVSKNGAVIAGTKSGTATITATASAGGAFDTLTLTVVPSLYEASLTSDTVTLAVSSVLDVADLLSLTDADGNEIDRDMCSFSLRSRDENTVSVSGTEIYALSEGSVSVRIIVYCGNVSRNVNLRVNVTSAEQESELSGEQTEKEEAADNGQISKEDESEKTDSKDTSDFDGTTETILPEVTDEKSDSDVENGTDLTEQTPETDLETEEDMQANAQGGTDSETEDQQVPEELQNHETEPENTDESTQETLPENDAEAGTETTVEEPVSEAKTEESTEEKTLSDEQNFAEEQTETVNLNEQMSVNDTPEIEEAAANTLD